MNSLPEASESIVRAEGQFVTFSVANEVFAVPLAPVQEIIRAPDVARLPLAPRSLDGLANLRGRVLPILSLRTIFGLPEREVDDATRAVVIESGQLLGFLVDQVRSVIHVQPHELVPAQQFRSLAQGDYLTAVIQRPRPEGPGSDLILVLDLARVVQKQFSRLIAQSAEGALPNTAPMSTSVGAAPDLMAAHGVIATEQRLVSFTVAGQEYGVDIADVREIVQCPNEWTVLPHAAPHVLGLISLRQRLLPLVGLRQLFGLPYAEPDERQRIVVVGLSDGAAVGLVTDTVKEVLTVPQDAAEPLPPTLSRDGGMREFSAICRLDEGRRLVSVLDIASLPGVQDLLLGAEITEQIQANTVHALHQEAVMKDDAQATASASGLDDDLQVVVFRLAGEEYGVPIMSVQEIVRVPETLTHIPRTPDYAEGVINLRGTVLPVIDQRSRLGLPRCERNDRQRIMVYHVGQRRTGFIVDSVAEVLRIDAHSIESAPELAPEQARLIRRVAKLDGDRRLVMLVEAQQLMADVGDCGNPAPMP
ncbi:chemotaxis protein CheW [Acidovorax lacteus]|uniref:Chemotaxis protein CheW n=1 Tax=Acidovorax lacteus TaxID=1924988 RepID=A0ABP8L6W3_9BURK